MLVGINWLSMSAQSVPQMIDAKYNQNAPYNNSCPAGTVTGCGPLAIAQILYMYKSPLHGYGNTSYKSGTNTIDVDFSKINFDWNNILSEYKNGQYSEYQANAVANLIYACGVAMHAQYGVSTSIGNYAQMLYGLQHNLHLSVDSRYLRRKFYSTAEWIEIMNRQLRDGHPLFYRGTWFFNDTRSDHMFVVDGLNSEGEYHVNFGHGGSGNKYVNINAINQSGTKPGGRGVCYNASQAMVINCFPTPDYAEYPLQRCVSEEAIILNDDIEQSCLTVDLGTTFTLSCKLRNYCAEKAQINYGWALMAGNKLIDVFGQRTYTLSSGYQFNDTRHLNVSLPSNLEDGAYKLSLYSKSDIVPEWTPVWECAPTEVDVTVNKGKATITIPENHQLDPLLYLADEIKEVNNEFENNTPGRSFALVINNNTVNNFENIVKLTIIADDQEYEYETTLPVYSQTSTEYDILIPQTKIDLRGKEITSVKASYYYELEDRFIDMTTTVPSAIKTAEINNMYSSDIYIYSINGVLVDRIKSCEVEKSYSFVLNCLPHGVYIVKEGKATRKVAL